MPSQSVLVIGGGLAGLSSAVALAEAGVGVRILEKRPHLGGRATSYTLPDGSEVDNCQHVTLGCCTNLADFYRRAGAGAKISFTTRCFSRMRRDSRSTIKAAELPAAAASGAVVFYFLADCRWRTSGASRSADRDCPIGREAAEPRRRIDAGLAAADETDAGSD